MPGHDLAEIGSVPSKYLCSSCKKLLNEPVQTKCGHFYCSSCLEDLRVSNHSLRCKEDQTWLTEDELFRDKCVEKEVLDILVLCPKTPCSWKGRLRELKSHFSNCLFIFIQCNVCGVMVQRQKINSHHQTCKAVIREAKREGWSALSSLSSISVLPSPTEVPDSIGCVFEQIGCRIPKTLTALQLKEHSKKCAEFHLNLLLRYIEELEQDLRGSLTQKIESLTKKVNDQEKKILHLENVTRGLWGLDAEALLRRLINTENMNANLEVLIMELSLGNEELRKKELQFEKQQENQVKLITQLQTRLDDQERAAGLRNVNISNLDEQFNLLTMTSFDGILVWKITDVTRKRNEAMTDRSVSFCSPPFYTDRYGYKMCARLYLNGDGLGRGQYLSLFFVVMRGEYDGLLRWPFRNKVTMMLLDQNHVEHVIDAFKPDPTSSSFQRPRREMNIASGCPMFCPLNELESHAYVKDDTMFIKVIVDSTDSY